jgi:hypothetical protein
MEPKGQQAARIDLDGVAGGLPNGRFKPVG